MSRQILVLNLAFCLSGIFSPDYFCIVVHIYMQSFIQAKLSGVKSEKYLGNERRKLKVKNEESSEEICVRLSV